MKVFLLPLILLFSKMALADSWSPPTELGAMSENTQYVLRVVPAEVNSNKAPIASLFEFDGVGYVERLSFTLVNDISPVHVRVTDSGGIFTFDNWHEVGIGKHVVAIYSVTGELRASYTLKELFSKDDYIRVGENRTVSSIWWRCSSSEIRARDSDVVVHDAIGGKFVFSDDGTFSYRESVSCTD